MLKQTFTYFLSAVLFAWLVLLSVYVCLQIYQQSAFSKQVSSVSLEKMREKTWDYLLYEKYQSLPNIKGYTIQERRHLLDVKRRIAQLEKSLLFTTIFGVFLLALNTWYRRPFRKVLSLMSKIELSFIILAVTLALLAFKPLFNLLHQWLFIPGTWVFMEDSYLIQLFPYHYFLEFFLLFIAILILFQLVLLMVTNGILKLQRATR